MKWSSLMEWQQQKLGMSRKVNQGAGDGNVKKRYRQNHENIFCIFFCLNNHASLVTARRRIAKKMLKTEVKFILNCWCKPYCLISNFVMFIKLTKLERKLQKLLSENIKLCDAINFHEMPHKKIVNVIFAKRLKAFLPILFSFNSNSR